MRVLMLVATSVATDSRVLREAASLVGAGHEVHVVGRAVPPDFAPPPGMTVSSAGGAGLRPGSMPSLSGRALAPHVALARWLLLPQHRRRSFGSWAAAAATAARFRSFDVVHAHDFTALGAGAELAAERGVPLVYDAHEWWRGRRREGRPSPLADRRDSRAERRWAAAAVTVLTVSEGIAERFRQWGLPEVRVVHNTFPPARRAAPEGSAAGAPVRGIVYAGRVAGGRDLDLVVSAAGALGPLRTTLVGPGDDGWLARLQHRSAANPLVRFHESLPVDDLDDMFRTEGLCVVPLEDTCDNHRLALPNKLFHAVRAGVPVVAADLPEIRRVVDTHGIGTVYRPGDFGSYVAAVRDALARHDRIRQAVRLAQRQLSWESDARVLLETYDELVGFRPSPGILRRPRTPPEEIP